MGRSAVAAWIVAACLAGTAAGQDTVGRVHVEAGQVVSEGLVPIDTASWDDTFELTTMEGVECFALGAQNAWLRLRLDPPWPQDDPGPATIGVRYLDDSSQDDPGPVTLQFDSADPVRLVNGAWAWSPPAWRWGTRNWLTAYWTVEKPAFRGRELGADFSVTGQTNRGHDVLHIAEVSVTRAGVLLAADVRGLALGDDGRAQITARVFAVDGRPAAEGTPVTFGATLGSCEPSETETTEGVARTEFLPGTEFGEAVVTAQCAFAANEMKLPLLQGTGGVTEVDWVVADFETEEEVAITTSYLRRATGDVAVSPEAAHAGQAGAALTYECQVDATWATAGIRVPVAIPGVPLQVEFRAKVSEPGVELRWALALEGEAGDWQRRGSTTVDPFAPTGDCLAQYPLTFDSVLIARSPWAKAEKGTLVVDDIVARLLVSGSEAQRLQQPGR
jgi:hypothetical protein